MQQNLPRLILAGTNSGCGKTTVTCAVLQALVNRGLSVAAAKCGPDYIDPMFHSRIIGAKSSNLDPFFFDENTLRFLLAQNASGCDVTVIEGVMGYYDGLGLTSTRASTYELAQKTVSPVVLVVNARGAALSVLASVRGFLDFLPDDRICGVILNGCTAMTYAPLARVLEDRLGVKACGFLPNLPDCATYSRSAGPTPRPKSLWTVTPSFCTTSVYAPFSNSADKFSVFISGASPSAVLFRSGS